jgi:hypothetical protein
VDDIKQIRKALRAQGWRLDDEGRHTKAYPPDKSMPPVVLPKTPGGGRWRENTIAQLRRSGFIWPPPT